MKSRRLVFAAAKAMVPAAGAAEPPEAEAATDLDKLGGQPADLAP